MKVSKVLSLLAFSVLMVAVVIVVAASLSVLAISSPTTFRKMEKKIAKNREK